jgi:hypothetical protein
MEMATTAGRPYQYLGERTRKEDLARQIAERDGIGDGWFASLRCSNCRGRSPWCGRSAAHSSSRHWGRVRGRYARRINPLLGELLRPMEYYWVTAQAEYSTDILFRKRADLQDLMPRLLEYSTLYFGAKEVMSLLGRKLVD